MVSFAKVERNHYSDVTMQDHFPFEHYQKIGHAKGDPRLEYEVSESPEFEKENACLDGRRERSENAGRQAELNQETQADDSNYRADSTDAKN